MIEQLDIYINAQKSIAHYMLCFGVILFGLAISFHFAGGGSVFNGLKIALLVLGVISLGSGFGYKVTEENLLKKQRILYQENTSQFHQVETERMKKVVNNFPIIQYSFIAIIVISLVVIVLTKNGLLQGVLFAVVIFVLGNMIIESVSKTSIHVYYQQLTES